MPTGMSADIRGDWPRWAERLRRNGLDAAVIWLLEAGGPLALLGAQMVHFGSPLLRPVLSDASMTGFIELLENVDERKSFINYLREAGKA